MQIVKYFIWVLLILLLANTLTWLTNGRSSALFQSLNLYDEFDFILATDTVYVFSDPDGFFGDYHSTRSMRYLNNFEEKTINEFLETVRDQSQNSEIIYFDTSSNNRIRHGNSILIITMSTSIPFFMYNHTHVMEGHYQLDYEQNYIWFFTWIPIGEPEIAES
jgi:hypothetical protein